MKDYMFVPAKNQATITPWYMRYGSILRDVLCLTSSAIMLILFAFIVGLR